MSRETEKDREWEKGREQKVLMEFDKKTCLQESHLSACAGLLYNKCYNKSWTWLIYKTNKDKTLAKIINNTSVFKALKNIEQIAQKLGANNWRL
jgi:hypothetical protein